MGRGLLMTLLKKWVHCHGSPCVITARPRPVPPVQTNGQPAAKQTIPSSAGMVAGERRMLNVPLHLVIDTEPLVYRRHGDLHLFTTATPSPLLSHFSPSPLCPLASLPQSSPFVAALHEVDITPPCCYDIDQPPPSLSSFSS